MIFLNIMFLIEENYSFPLSKIEHNYAAPFVLKFPKCEWDTFLKLRIYKRTKQNHKKTWKWKTSLCWKELFFVDKGRFEHILNIFKQRPSWCPLIHLSSSTFCPGSCCSGAPIQKGGPEAFPQRPTFLGDMGLSKVNSNFQPPMQVQQHLHKRFQWQISSILFSIWYVFRGCRWVK